MSFFKRKYESGSGDIYDDPISHGLARRDSGRLLAEKLASQTGSTMNL